jgi:hypothetical protein
MSSNQSRDAFVSIVALCGKDETRPEPELIMRPEIIIRSNPTVMSERDENGMTLRSVEFVTLLIEADGGLECVHVQTSGTIHQRGWLPFHHACNFVNVEVAKYLHELYPESINI